MARTAMVDRAAVGFSFACVLHCLALPVIAISLPVIVMFAEAEWLHWLFAALSITASGTVMLFAKNARHPRFLVPALLGITFLGGALLAEPFGVEETLPTVLGSLLLASAHIYRLIKHK